MESPDYSPPQTDSSRPSLGFPLGTALLLIVIFSLSGIFSCCYHWDKLRSFRRSLSRGTDVEAGSDPDTASKAALADMEMKQNQNQSLPVLMPGDEVPKFIAMPCPSERPRLEKIVVETPKPPPTPPKPPRIAVPLY